MTEESWPLNYFNYFTEVEEHFQRARGTGLFLLSPLDWALIETWKNAGIPLDAVRRGIDAAFEKWRSGKQRGRMVNSLAYCTQAVIDEAQRMEGGGPPKAVPVEAPFALEDLVRHLQQALDRLSRPETVDVANALRDLLANAGEHFANLEALEQRLSALEDKLIATLRAGQSPENLARARAELDHQLRPYRSKLTAPQLAMLEKQYLDRWLIERADLPRLSLFYLR